MAILIVTSPGLPWTDMSSCRYTHGYFVIHGLTWLSILFKIQPWCLWLPIVETNFYRLRSLAKQGDNELGSICLSVCPSVCPFEYLCFHGWTIWPRVQSAAKSNESHFQSEVFVCVSVIRWCLRIIARCGRSAFTFQDDGTSCSFDTHLVFDVSR